MLPCTAASGATKLYEMRDERGEGTRGERGREGRGDEGGKGQGPILILISIQVLWRSRVYA